MKGGETGIASADSSPPPPAAATAAGYAEQTDLHNPCMTVRESIAFSCELRLLNQDITRAAVRLHSLA